MQFPIQERYTIKYGHGPIEPQQYSWITHDIINAPATCVNPD